VKLAELVPVPPAVVTLILPVTAPTGTVAVIWVAELTVKLVAATPPNFTEVAPVKPVPWIVTEVPTGPLVGVKDVIVGAVVTVKSDALVAVPPGVVTVILPVTAPVGTVAVTRVPAPFTENVVAATPPNFTEVAPPKFVPLIVTEVPTGPLVGLNELMVGASTATAEGTPRSPTKSTTRVRQAETRRGSRPVFIRCLPTRAGAGTIVAPRRYSDPVRRRKLDER